MSAPKQIDALRLRQIIEFCLRRELPANQPLPRLDEDLVASGALDSRAWAGIIGCVEAAANVPDLGARLAEAPASIASLLAALESPTAPRLRRSPKMAALQRARGDGQALILGWGEALGSQVIPAEQVESEFGLTPGKLRDRAGIESVRRVTGPENEFNLAAVATRAALKRARAKPADLDFLIVTSETSLGYPSLGAQLHSRLLARDTCGVLDVGGACLGLLNAFAIARSLIAGGSARKVLVVSADVHTDRKSTRLNSSHSQISYAVFCLKKKNIHYGGSTGWSPHTAGNGANGFHARPKTSARRLARSLPLSPKHASRAPIRAVWYHIART